MNAEARTSDKTEVMFVVSCEIRTVVLLQRLGKSEGRRFVRLIAEFDHITGSKKIKG